MAMMVIKQPRETTIIIIAIEDRTVFSKYSVDHNNKLKKNQQQISQRDRIASKASKQASNIEHQQQPTSFT
jgi:hypothetical protein